jgi:hypothetical protein
VHRGFGSPGYARNSSCNRRATGGHVASMRSEAAAVLATVATPAEICAALGANKSCVSRWLSGRTLPSDERQAQIERVWPAVPAAAWKRREGAPAGSGDQGAEPPDTEADAGSRERAAAHLRRVQAWRERAEREGTAVEVAKAHEAERKALELCARLAGELTFDEARVLESPRFRAAAAAIFDALRPHPEALRAVRDALARLEAAP